MVLPSIGAGVTAPVSGLVVECWPSPVAPTTVKLSVMAPADGGARAGSSPKLERSKTTFTAPEAKLPVSR